MSSIRVLITVLLLGCLGSIYAAQGPLDGTRFGIDFAANKDDPPHRPAGSDILLFDKGLGECKKAGKAYGYEKKSYEATQVKGVINFTFTMESGKHGSLTFKGQIQGDNIAGQRIWSKPGKDAIVHNFTGKKQ